MRPDRDAILKALDQVIDPELRRPVTELDMVRDVLNEDDDSVSVTIALTVAGCPLRNSFEEQVTRPAGAVRAQAHVDRLLPRGQRADHVARPAAAQVARAVPLGRALGRARHARRRYAPVYGGRADVARPAPPAGGGARGDDSTAGSAA